jgi:hypothetical protein
MHPLWATSSPTSLLPADSYLHLFDRLDTPWLELHSCSALLSYTQFRIPWEDRKGLGWIPKPGKCQFQKILGIQTIPGSHERIFSPHQVIKNIPSRRQKTFRSIQWILLSTHHMHLHCTWCYRSSTSRIQTWDDIGHVPAYIKHLDIY